MAAFKITVLFFITILHHPPSFFTLEVATSQMHNTSLNLYHVPSYEDSARYAFANVLHFFTVRPRTENMVCSPVAVYTSLAYIYLGTLGCTSAEISRGLFITEYDKMVFERKYGEILKIKFNNSKNNDEAPQLSMAVRLFVNRKLKVRESFNKLAQEIFGYDYKVEYVNFDQPLMAIEQITNWAEQKTGQRIRNFLKPNDVNAKTANVLINAINFKAKWLFPFSKNNTKQSTFHTSGDKKTDVELMYQNVHIRYTKLPRLDAEAIELPYKNSTISMLIILPNRVEGLKQLGKKLIRKDLDQIIAQMVVEDVDVYLPKFRIESDIKLKKILRKIGIFAIFSYSSDFSAMFQNAAPVSILEFRQRVVFDCNEGGSEAASTTYVKSEDRSFNSNKKIFSATHPFVFFVRNENTILFSGHVTMG